MLPAGFHLIFLIHLQFGYILCCNNPSQSEISEKEDLDALIHPGVFPEKESFFVYFEVL